MDCKLCDVCGKLITENQDLHAVTLNVNGGCELTQDSEGTDYDLHEHCWKQKIKSLFKKRA